MGVSTVMSSKAWVWRLAFRACCTVWISKNVIEHWVGWCTGYADFKMGDRKRELQSYVGQVMIRETGGLMDSKNADKLLGTGSR